MSSPRFKGVYTAVVTPFHQDGSVDLEAYREIVEDQLQMGLDGIVPCGTTGEAATLSPEEHLSVVKACVEQVAGRVPVVAGAGANWTQKAVEMTRAIKELGVDGALQVTPWYNKPTQEGHYRHFMACAEVGLPVMLYNVPGRTGADLLPATVKRLIDDSPNICAIKEATGSAQRAEAILTLTQDREDFSILSGEDSFILGLLALGGHGVVSVVSHLCAKEIVHMFKAFESGDLQTAQALSKRISALQPTLFFRANPLPVKHALVLAGKLKEANFRLPMCPLDDEEVKELKGRLADGGWLS